MAINSAFLNFSSSCCNSFFFFRFIWFMVFWKLDNFSISAKCCSWVSGISNINCILNHKNNISCTSDRINNFTSSCKGLKTTLYGNFVQFLLSFLSIKQFVKGFESLLKGQFIILFDKVLIFFKYFNNVTSTESRDLYSSVTIKNSK